MLQNVYSQNRDGYDVVGCSRVGFGWVKGGSVGSCGGKVACEYRQGLVCGVAVEGVVVWISQPCGCYDSFFLNYHHTYLLLFFLS